MDHCGQNLGRRGAPLIALISRPNAALAAPVSVAPATIPTVHTAASPAVTTDAACPTGAGRVCPERHCRAGSFRLRQGPQSFRII